MEVKEEILSKEMTLIIDGTLQYLTSLSFGSYKFITNDTFVKVHDKVSDKVSASALPESTFQQLITLVNTDVILPVNKVERTFRLLTK